MRNQRTPKTAGQRLVEYLNARHETPEAQALQRVARYLALEHIEVPSDLLKDHVVLVKAWKLVERSMRDAYRNSEPSLGVPATGGDPSYHERWSNSEIALYRKQGVAEITEDERAALNLFDHMLRERDEMALLGKRWKPRLKVCSGPGCGKFIYDATLDRKRKTCSGRCRMAMLRAR